MPLDRLISAKKSFSGLFSRMSVVPIQPCSPKQDENDPPSYQTPSPCSPGASATVPDISDDSPTKETTSMRKGLMGSLRKQKLRSISSLRSLRSPTKTKHSDTSECLLADSPHTPKHHLNSSLILHFEQSPSDRPIFDLDSRDSPTSSLIVHHSSPVPVPSSDRQIPRSRTDLSLIPDGTVPPSPAPLQKILDLDHTRVSPSSTCTPTYEPSSERMRRPSSAKSALSDSLREAAVYFDEPLVRFPNSGSHNLTVEDYFTVPVSGEHSRQTSAQEDLSGVCRMDSSPEHNKQDEPMGSAIKEAANATEIDKTPEEHARLILEKGYHARVYRQADGQCRLKIRLLAFDPEDGDENQLNSETPFRLAAHEEEMLASQLSAVIRERGFAPTSDGRLDEAFAAGRFPAYLDVSPDWDVSKGVRSNVHSPTDMQKRDSTWGQHTGLYDGTGYGAGTSSRPMTGMTETAGIPRTRVPGAFIDHENEAPIIIRRLWDSTCPPSPDADSPVQAVEADTAISEAREKPESHLKDYEAFQGMLDPRGNA